MSTLRTVFLQIPAFTNILYIELDNTEIGGWTNTGKKLKKRRSN